MLRLTCTTGSFFIVVMVTLHVGLPDGHSPADGHPMQQNTTVIFPSGLPFNLSVNLSTGYKQGRYHGRPISYGANVISTYHGHRIKLSNDIELNPGPQQTSASLSSLCDDMLTLKGIKIALLNIVSLLGEDNIKIDTLRLVLQKMPVDVLCVNETRLSSQITSEEVSIDGYSLYRNDRNRRGGGVAIYVNNKYQCVHRDEFQCDSIESTWIEIGLRQSKPLIIGTIYRPPEEKVEYIDRLKDHLNNVTDAAGSNDIIVTGDFNLDLHKPETAKTMKQICQQFQLHNVIDTPTRITEKSATCIDLILVSNENKLYTSGNIPVGFSDHNLVYMTYKSRPVKAKPKILKTRSYRKFDSSLFHDDLNNTDWNFVFQADNPEIAWCCFKDKFKQISDKHAPLVEVRVKGNQPSWFNEDILSMCKDRDYYKGKAQKSGSAKDWELYRNIRNQTTNMIKQVKKTYYTDTIKENKDDSKQLWKTIKTLLPSKVHGKISEINVDGKQLCDPKQIADTFNAFFVQVGQKLAQRFVSSKECELPNYSGEPLQFVDIEEEFVQKQLSTLCINKATGLDGLSSRLLREGAAHIAKPLTHIMNLTISTGIIPTEWKQAIVTPIFKDGLKTECGNYRPISVLPVVSKILERAIHKQVYNHLLSKGLLSNMQSGFRPQHSTLTCITDVTDYLLNNMENGEFTGAVMLDLKKAFDTVNYEVLLSKLKHLGIVGREWDWFSNYLSNRQQCTSIDGVHSELMRVTVGVPQGSILGPLLFIAFINDMPDVLSKSKVVLYADDTAVMYNSNSRDDIEDVLNKELALVAEWMHVNKLTVNASKTKVMLFGSQRKLKNSVLNIKLNNEKLEHVHVFKYLGMWFDSHLKWNTHVKKTASKISQKTGILRRMRYYIDQKTMAMLYNAIILPHIDYCCPINASAADKLINKIQVLQNRAARLTLGCKVRDKHVSEIYSDLNWMMVDQRANYFKCILMYRCINKLAPEYLVQNIHDRMKSHGYGTRLHDTINIRVGRSKTNWGKRTFQNSGAYLWNHLPAKVKNSPNVHIFKKMLKAHILN